ncbi:hypothetical protein [Paraburkholderia acidiphila]|uniref:hypothetical protein n=1 Tax=Paraburkholderia acidiphila TaxID=2571747 RepID=UPI001E59FADA|nr:hypothetical protein [Paraburkholderia acidiphila]
MTLYLSSQALSPSDYVARHLQNFASSTPASAIGRGHPQWIVWNEGVFVVAGVLFVVLACIGARRDKWALFALSPAVSFGRRLYVWWSCAWRQWLASALLFVAAWFVLRLSLGKIAAPLMAFAANRVPHDVAQSSPAISLAIAGMPFIVPALAYVLLSLPLAGYMVRRGLAAHAMPAPRHFGFWRATLLGLTTYAWTLPASLAIANVGIAASHPLADALRAILLVAWGMYIVLPRQARSVARLASPG